MKRKPIPVTLIRQFDPTRRRYGGQGILTRPEPYAGPPVLEFKEQRRRRARTFLAVRLERSPTGSGHGSFRIDEVLRNGQVITLGYTCSYPDLNLCRIVAREASEHFHV